MTWDDPLAQGNVTLPDCSVIFQMCFNVLSCSNTTVTFGDNPTPIEIVNNALQVIPFTSCPGTVSCGTQQQGPTIANANITNVACRGQSTGAITVQATGPGTLSYAWSVAGAGNTPTITGRPAGTYSVTVTSSSGGTPATATYTITQPATAVTINNITATDVSCEGGDDGSILVSASGGTGTLSYAWSAPPPNPGNTPNAMNLIPFSFYRVTVTDASGCTAVSMLTEIEEPTAIVVTAMSIQNVLCAGASTGAITLGVTGGTGPYTYNWSGTAPDTNPTTGLPAGVYSVTVTDSRSCTQTLNNINVVSLNPAVAITNTAVTDLNDGNPGAVNITVQGGSGTYTYVWTGPGGFSASTQDISNLATGGQYCVTVTDGNGCTTNTCATVGEDLAITTFSINKACSGTSDGDVDITVSGGTAPYTYQWRNSSNALMTGTPQDLVNVAPGTYNVTVSDANTNTVTGSFEVTSHAAINIASNIGSATSGNNGSVALTLTGGTPPFNVVWSGTNQTGPSISNLAVGQYCATITDANFCTATGCYMVTAQPFAIGTVTPTNVLCNGATTGTLAVNVLGGTPPYTLTINSTPYNSANGAFNITGLGANNWAFTVTDNTGALLNSNATITQPAAITATSTINHDTEDPGCTGSITLNISGGTPGYTVLWNGPVGPQIISLCAGNYIPTIQDANGCNVTLPAIALNTFSETAVSANVDCPTDEDGSINLTVSGGNTPYTFEWKNAGGVVVSDDEDLANATPGTYTVRITDASGLVLVRQYTVTAQSNFSVSPQVTSNYSNFAVSCADATDGSAVANIAGSGDFDVVWESNGNTFVGATLQNAGSGSYTATVTDELGCEVTASLTLNAPPALVLNANVIAVSCLDDKNGEIQVFASGGIPGIYQYQWSNGIFGNQVRFLGAGNYTVTATDLNGCEKVETYALADPTPILVTFDIEPATEGFNGTVRAIVSGGQMPYRYEWVNLNSSDFSSVVSSLAPGEYYLIVTDDNGCRTSTLTAVVPDERYPCLEERVVITPDGNGANDEFIIFCIGDLPNNNLEIYNRWGQLVFETENYDNTWAGTSQNGSPLPDGPYYYVLEYTNPDGMPVQAKGSLTIVRE
jgi:gliding motility-associated-like protein